MTKREAAFALFEEGKSPSSPEVKALKIKAQTRANYYWEWKKGREAKGTPLSSTPTGEAKGKGKVISELEMVTPPEEAEEEEKESNGEGEEAEESETPEPKAKKEAKPSDGKKPPPTMVAGQGLTFAITISTKTLMLYQIAASQMEEELTLGDFIDACVEDAYQGRGFDLGLIKVGGKGNG